MYKKMTLLVLLVFMAFLVSGCVVRTYPVIKERVDQDAEGNRGYLQGGSSDSTVAPKKTTRKVQVVEFELYPIKVEEGPRASSKAAKSQEPSAGAKEGMQARPQTVQVPITVVSSVVAEPEEATMTVIKNYTVKKGDTLQTISRKFYGTTKRWNEIYESNRKILKSPHSIYPGQVIEVPIEEVSGIK